MRSHPASDLILTALPVLLLPLSLTACHSSSQTHVDATEHSVTQARLTQVVPPITSSEQCYNAWDDNENGLIDEGCALQQTPVQVLVAWDDDQADLDLLVFDPKGEVATPQASTASGMSLAQDCPETEGCGEQPYEMVYSEDTEYQPGRYRIQVIARQFDRKNVPFVARLGIRTPEGTQAYRLEFYDQAQMLEQDFFVARTEQKE